MGANAQTSVPAFTAGQVLTAVQQTQINTGIPVFASTTTRDAAFGGSGEKTLAEGQYAYIEATNETQVYNGSAWVGVGATALINRTSFTNVASQIFDGVFTSSYAAYIVVIENLYGATATSYISWQWRYGGVTETANCNSAGYGINSSGAASSATANNASEIVVSNQIGSSTLPSSGWMMVSGVGVAGYPRFTGTIWTSNDEVNRDIGGNCTTSRTFDGFLIKSSSGNVTGTIAIYGLATA